MFARPMNITTNGQQANRRAFRDVTNSRNGDENSRPGKIEKKTIVGSLNPVIAPVFNNNDNPAAVAPFAPAFVNPSAQNAAAENEIARAAEAKSYQFSGQCDNIDERDANDPLCATDYVQEMYRHFRLKETTTSVRPLYMESQPHINERMRSILVDWLVEVHLKFKLVPETLYLTVNIIDRYLERKEVTRPKLQLVGVTSLLIASKYEEIYPPELRDLVYICDRAYTRQEIIEMEETVLKTLEYKITIPSAHAFLVRYLKAAHADKRIVQLSCYILDGTLQSFNLLHFQPSQLAAAAVFIARRTVGRNSWSPTLLRYASYCEEEIAPVARAILAEKSSASTDLRAVSKKYSSSRYGAVATTVLQCDF